MFFRYHDLRLVMTTDYKPTGFTGFTVFTVFTKFTGLFNRRFRAALLKGDS